MDNFFLKCKINIEYYFSCCTLYVMCHNFWAFTMPLERESLVFTIKQKNECNIYNT